MVGVDGGVGWFLVGGVDGGEVGGEGTLAAKCLSQSSSRLPRNWVTASCPCSSACTADVSHCNNFIHFKWFVRGNSLAAAHLCLVCTAALAQAPAPPMLVIKGYS